MTEQNNLIDREPESNDELGIGFKILSFIIPIAGAVLYFMNKNGSPNKAKSACNFALFGIGFGILLNIVSVMVLGAQ